MEAFDYDCLGCLMAARDSGEITSEEYEELATQWEVARKMERVPCPRCGQHAYVSLYEPSMAHCPDCGCWCVQDPVTGEYALAWEWKLSKEAV